MHIRTPTVSVQSNRKTLPARARGLGGGGVSGPALRPRPRRLWKVLQGGSALRGRRDIRRQMALPHREPEPGPQGARKEAPPEVRAGASLPFRITNLLARSRAGAGLQPEPGGKRGASGRKSEAVPGRLWRPARAPSLGGSARGGASAGACALEGRWCGRSVPLSPSLIVPWPGRAEMEVMS